MQQKIGIHVLTAFPPSNPNRDENGQPKTAIVGGITRQRISSQCIKRTWRLADVFKEFEGRFSCRTRAFGLEVLKYMLDNGAEEKQAKEFAGAVTKKFGKVKGTKEKDEQKEKERLFRTLEVVVIGHEERAAAFALADTLILEERGATEEEINALEKPSTSLDVALFGRMRANNTSVNVDASVCVSHPLTVGKCAIDDDFWTATDDLSKSHSDDAGSAGMGNTEFGSGTYYTYVEVNLPALVQNLDGDVDTAQKGVLALIEAIATTSPSGYSNTFGNKVRASWLRVEVGEPSGNLFMKAFEEPAKRLPEAIERIQKAVQNEVGAYGLDQDAFEFSVGAPQVPLKRVLCDVKARLSVEG